MITIIRFALIFHKSDGGHLENGQNSILMAGMSLEDSNELKKSISFILKKVQIIRADLFFAKTDGGHLVFGNW